MNINIQSKVTQQATSEQLDAIAHDYLGVQLSLDDESMGCRKENEMTLPASINATDGTYSDTQEAFAEKGITVKADKSYVRIIDSAAKDIFLANFTHADDGKFTPSEMSSITDIGTIFANATNVVNLDVLKYTNISGFAQSYNTFRYCSSLKSMKLPPSMTWLRCGALGSQDYSDDVKLIRLNSDIDGVIDLGYITSLQSGGAVGSCIRHYGTIVIGKNVTQLGEAAFYGSPYMKVCFMPKVEDIGVSAIGDYGRTLFGACPNFKLFDIGNSLTTALALRAMANEIIICRTLTPATATNLGSSALSYIFVPSNVVSEYQSAENWSTFNSKIYAIGGTEWQEYMQSLATGEGKTLNSIHREFPTYADVDWSYEYIDYLIYGVEPPTA